MWDVLGKSLNIFLEKHLIPTIISVVVTILLLLYLPTDFWMYNKIGKILLSLLIAGITFLAIQFITFSYKKFKKCICQISYKKLHKKETFQKLNDDLESLWRYVDSLIPEDKELLKSFIISDNTPITKSAGIHYSGNRLFTSEWIVSTEEYGEEFPPANIPKEMEGIIIPTNIFDTYGGKEIITKYKLKDDFFRLLKYSMDTYGKISHFE